MNNPTKSMTMHDAINAGCYFHVSIPAWASGGMDVMADTAEAAALHVGCMMEAWGGRHRPAVAKVARHMGNSRIGCSVLESIGTFQTLTADHYCI